MLLNSATASSAEALKIYSLKSKLFVAEVAATTPYEVERVVGKWKIIRFTTPVVPTWVSADFVQEVDGHVTVLADRLNLRMGPSTSDRVLAGVAKGFNSKALARENGFIKVYAPTWVLFSLPAESGKGLPTSPGTQTTRGTTVSGTKWITANKVEAAQVTNQSEAEENAVQSDTAATGDTKVAETAQPGPVTSNIASEDGIAATSDSSTLLRVSGSADSGTESAAPQAAVAIASPQPESARFIDVPPVVNEAQTIALLHRLSPGDSISLKVFGEPDLSLSTVRIPQSGRVSFPLIGSVLVAQKTTKEVENILRETLSQGYINDPQLLVSIDSYRPIFVKGAVQQTGAFPYTEGLTVAKVIALAGGAKNSARQDGVSISRDGNELQTNLSVDSQYQISSGDILSIEEEIGVSEESGLYVYLHGEVSRPGEYKFRRGLTVEKAVVLAGGFTLRASRKRISVSRIVEGGDAPVKLKKVDLYMPVQPGDIIDVGASWF